MTRKIKRKARIPKIQLDKKGNAFVRIGKTKVRIHKNISQTDLIKYLIKMIAKHNNPTHSKVEKEEQLKTITRNIMPTSISGNSGSQLMERRNLDQYEQGQRDKTELKQKQSEQEIMQKEEDEIRDYEKQDVEVKKEQFKEIAKEAKKQIDILGKLSWHEARQLTKKQKEARRKAQRELYKKSSSSSSSSAIPVEEEDAHHNYYSSADEGLQTNDDERELPISVFAKNQEELPSDDDDRELPHNVFAKKK